MPCDSKAQLCLAAEAPGRLSTAKEQFSRGYGSCVPLPGCASCGEAVRIRSSSLLHLIGYANLSCFAEGSTPYL